MTKGLWTTSQSRSDTAGFKRASEEARARSSNRCAARMDSQNRSSAKARPKPKPIRAEGKYRKLRRGQPLHSRCVQQATEPFERLTADLAARRQRARQRPAARTTQRSQAHQPGRWSRGHARSLWDSGFGSLRSSVSSYVGQMQVFSSLIVGGC